MTDQIAYLKKVNDLYLLEIDQKFLRNHASVRVEACIDGHRYKTFAFKRKKQLSA